jgi:hypothetical protein
MSVMIATTRATAATSSEPIAMRLLPTAQLRRLLGVEEG